MYKLYTLKFREGGIVGNSGEVIALADLRGRLGETVDRANYAGERVLITRNGKSAAAIVPVEDLLLLEEIEQVADRELLRRARVQDDGTRTRLEELLKRFAEEDAREEAGALTAE